MYVPAEDTLFLAKCAKRYKGKWALEVGIGSGLVAQSLLENFANVVGTDIDLASLDYCKGKGVMLVCCDAASALCSGGNSSSSSNNGGNNNNNNNNNNKKRFDLIISNPPYLPGDPKADLTVYGGPSGIETTLHFVESVLPLLAEDGRILVIVSSLSDASGLDKFVQTKKLKKNVVAEKTLFYERLYAVELTF
jgi:release factor glutamine methyltransferase